MMALPLAAACGRADARQAPPLPPTPGRLHVAEVIHARYSGIPRPRQWLVRSPGEWAAVPLSIGSDERTNFAQDMLVAVAPGVRGPGATIDFDGYRTSGDTMFIYLRTTNPNACDHDNATPLIVGRVPRWSGRVLFIADSRGVRCPEY